MALRQYSFEKAKTVEKFADDFGKLGRKLDERVDRYFSAKLVIKSNVGYFCTSINDKTVPDKINKFLSIGKETETIANLTGKNLRRYQSKGKKIADYNPNEFPVEPAAETEVEPRGEEISDVVSGTDTGASQKDEEILPEVYFTSSELSRLNGARNRVHVKRILANLENEGKVESRPRDNDKYYTVGRREKEYTANADLAYAVFADESKAKEFLEQVRKGTLLIPDVVKKNLEQLLARVAKKEFLFLEEIAEYDGLFKYTLLVKRLSTMAKNGSISVDDQLRKAQTGRTKYQLNFGALKSLAKDDATKKTIDDYVANLAKADVTKPAVARDVEEITADEWAKATTTNVEDNNGRKFSNVLELTLPTGEKFVFKPLKLQREQQIHVNGKPSGDPVDVKNQCINEAAAWIVDDAFGFGIVRKTMIKELPFTHTDIKCKDFGAVREYLPEFYNAKEHECWPENIPDEQFNSRKALKFIINDKDQKPENLGFDAVQNKIVMLDTALAFDESIDSSIRKILDEVKPEDKLMEMLSKVNDANFRYQLIRRLRELNLNGLTLTDEQITAVISRAEKLHAKLVT